MEGGTNRSYGIQVARLAGVPDEVIVRAGEILRNLEGGELDASGMPKIARGRRSDRKNANQLSLFPANGDAILDEIRSLDPLRLTPLDALGHLSDWKKRLEQGG